MACLLCWHQSPTMCGEHIQEESCPFSIATVLSEVPPCLGRATVFFSRPLRVLACEATTSWRPSGQPRMLPWKHHPDALICCVAECWPWPTMRCDQLQGRRPSPGSTQPLTWAESGGYSVWSHVVHLVRDTGQWANASWYVLYSILVNVSLLWSSPNSLELYHCQELLNLSPTEMAQLITFRFCLTAAH